MDKKFANEVQLDRLAEAILAEVQHRGPLEPAQLTQEFSHGRREDQAVIDAAIRQLVDKHQCEYRDDLPGHPIGLCTDPHCPRRAP